MADIYHPDLDTVIAVADSAVEIHRRSGWRPLAEWRESQDLIAARREQQEKDQADQAAKDQRAADRDAAKPAAKE